MKRAGYSTLYYILKGIAFIGSLPYRLITLLKTIIIFFINLTILLVCTVIAAVLLAGVIILKTVNTLFSGLKKLLKGIKSPLHSTGKFILRYKLPLFTPIVFFILIYVIVFMISNVKSEEKKEFVPPKWVRIYDVNGIILYNGQLENFENTTYKRAPEIVNHILQDIGMNNNYNVSNQDEVAVYTTIDINVQNTIQQYFRDKVDVQRTPTTGVVVFDTHQNKILGMVKVPEKTSYFKIIAKITDGNGKKLYGGISYLPF